jgi:hypothetical protein
MKKRWKRRRRRRRTKRIRMRKDHQKKLLLSCLIDPKELIRFGFKIEPNFYQTEN